MHNKTQNGKNGNQKKLNCSQCEQMFKDVVELTKHFQSVHIGNKPFKCEICHARFTQKHDLVQHMESVHDGKN